MNQSNRPSAMSILFILLLGTGAVLSALWLAGQRQAVPNADVILAALILVFFVSFAWAFLLYLRWRDKGRAASAPVLPRSNPDLEGTVYGMIPGREYQVLKPFTDHYGNLFTQGERLRFKQRHFLPYHGGHTILFEERALYLQEDQNREILDHFSDYFELMR